MNRRRLTWPWIAFVSGLLMCTASAILMLAGDSYPLHHGAGQSLFFSICATIGGLVWIGHDRERRSRHRPPEAP